MPLPTNAIRVEGQPHISVMLGAREEHRHPPWQFVGHRPATWSLSFGLGAWLSSPPASMCLNSALPAPPALVQLP